MPARPQSMPVHFVGAGPGAAEHLTLAALRAIEAAEVVFHDRLVGEEVMAFLPPDAERIAVGKEGFGPSIPQDVITAALVTAARSGRRVVRLKGGDAGLFARLDEETEALARAGLPFRIVPGLTAGAVAAAAIGRSLTRRGRNSSVSFVTGHDMAGFAELDWRALARPGAVAAIYMGKASARFICGRLMMHGAPAEAPVTLVENVSRPDQRILSVPLASLPEAAADLAGPAIILWGLSPRHVASARDQLKEVLA